MMISWFSGTILTLLHKLLVCELPWPIFGAKMTIASSSTSPVQSVYFLRVHFTKYGYSLIKSYNNRIRIIGERSCSAWHIWFSLVLFCSFSRCLPSWRLRPWRFSSWPLHLSCSWAARLVNCNAQFIWVYQFTKYFWTFTCYVVKRRKNSNDSFDIIYSIYQWWQLWNMLSMLTILFTSFWRLSRNMSCGLWHVIYGAFSALGTW